MLDAALYPRSWRAVSESQNSSTIKINIGQRVSSFCSRQTPASDISEDRAGAAHGAVPFAAPHVTGPRPVAPTLSSIPCPLPSPPTVAWHEAFAAEGGGGGGTAASLIKRLSNL